MFLFIYFIVWYFFTIFSIAILYKQYSIGVVNLVNLSMKKIVLKNNGLIFNW